LKSKTVVISLVIHLGLAFALFGATNRRVSARRQATAVRLADEKKKPPPPPKPKAEVKPQPRKVASIPKEEPLAKAPAAAPKTVAVATAIKMTADDVATPGDIVVPSGKALASVGPPPSKRPRLGEGQGEDAPCHAEPSKPEPVYKTEIELTARAKAEGTEGKLKLRLTVGRDGSVVNVDVLGSVAPDVDAAAVEAAKKWRFRPAMACGRPVAGGTYVLVRIFELTD
jgi:protein TonB